jgi:NAD-dependent dihydropyrimidine dehydrogenase PreA subunit
MAKKITVVVSQGQSAHPDKRNLEESLVGSLLMERGVEVTVIPHLYDLAPSSTGMLCLEGIAGDMILLSWLYPRAAHWTLDRNGIKGHFGRTLLKSDADDEDDEAEAERAEQDERDEKDRDDKDRVGGRNLPNRAIYHLHLSAQNRPEPFVEEIKRILAEASVETVGLMGWIQGSPKPEQLARYLDPTGQNGNRSENGGSSLPLLPLGEGRDEGARSDGPHPNPKGEGIAQLPLQSHLAEPSAEATRIAETPARRWYPVIDYSRCTNCMECIDFCLFGVYGVDGAETILVEQPDNCRKGCPACSRVCPENAIIFPQHKSPAIAGSPDENAGGLKIDLSQLFGAPNAIEIAAIERDVELVAVGRDAVGLSIGIPKRQAGKEQAPKDELDSLMDQLDDLGL